MAYLQLAENMENYNMLAEGSVLNNYLTIPPGFMNNEQTKYVRVDFFDDLPEEQFALTMAKLAPYQPVTLLSAGKGSGLIGAASFAAGFIPGVGPIVSKVVEKAGPMAVGLIGKKNARKKEKAAGKGELKKTAVPLPDIDANVSVGGKDFAIQYATGLEPEKGSFLKKYKTPLIIGGAVVAVVAGYMLLKKKK